LPGLFFIPGRKACEGEGGEPFFGSMRARTERTGL
jgi:hypothetical protein